MATTKRVMAVKRTTEPSSGQTIFATQVLELDAADAKTLIAAGDAVETAEPITRDIGLLAKNAGVGKDYADA
jgi:hypothetical protein